MLLTWWVNHAGNIVLFIVHCFIFSNVKLQLPTVSQDSPPSGRDVTVRAVQSPNSKHNRLPSVCKPWTIINCYWIIIWDSSGDTYKLLWGPCANALLSRRLFFFVSWKLFKFTFKKTGISCAVVLNTAKDHKGPQRTSETPQRTAKDPRNVAKGPQRSSETPQRMLLARF